VTDFDLQNQDCPAWLLRADTAADILAGFDFQPDAWCADIGCGDGKLKNAMATKGVTLEWRGYDLNPQANNIAEFDVCRHEQDLEGSPAVIVMLGVLEYLENRVEVLSRLLAKSPRLIVSHAMKKLAGGVVAEELDSAGWVVTLRVVTPDRKNGLFLCERRGS
jgi:hypothetical protein